MNHAERVKELVKLTDAVRSDKAELHKAIDAMQSALDDAVAKLAARDAEVSAVRTGLNELNKLLCVKDAEVERLRKDAERYRWLRCPKQDVSLVLDKRTGFVPISDDGLAGGYWIYEYRAGDELDAAIDAALSEEVKGGE